MAQVEIENLTRRFDDITAIDELTFSVESGEIFGLVGPDGAGKTTCLRILCGLLVPDSGRINILGRDVVADPESIKPEIGYMSQRFGLYDDLTVSENIRFYADLYEVPRSEYQERTKRLLEFSGLSPFTDRLFRNLSGGMKQKVGLSCALIHTPKILFLDEPTNGVDPVSRRDFWKILYELNRDGVTIIVATTYLDEADRCHRLALLDHGKARAVTEPMALRDRMEGQLFRLRVTDRREVLRLLQSIPQVLSPNIHGPILHFSLADEASLEMVSKRLEETGHEILELTRNRPTLEDAYLSILQQEAEAEA